MRLLFFLICLSVSSLVTAQELNLDQSLGFTLPEMPLPTALKRIEQATEWRFSYSSRELPANRRVALRDADQSLRTTMNQWLRDTGLSYRLIGGQVVIYRGASPQPSAQQTYLLSGYLRDSLSQEAIVGGRVQVPEAQTQATSNRYGFFQLRLPPGQYQLQARAYGYPARSRTVALQQDTLLDWDLAPLPRDLDSVQIEAELPQRELSVGKLSLSAQEVQAVPALLGETDVLKAFQLMPGVQGGAEGSSGLYVRGGTPDQNLILLDGVPVYNAAHAFSLFSVFNPDAINHVELYKGGIPARYGGRLSSVMDIGLKEGNRREFGGKAALGLISGKLMLEGPIRWGKDRDSEEAATSYLVSGRRTWLDLLAGPIQRAGNPQGTRTNYFFHDLTAKVNHRFAPGSELYASFYSGKDRLRQADDATPPSFTNFRSDLEWGNRTGVLRWNQLLGERLYSQMSAYVSDYRFVVDVESERESSAGPDTLLDALRYRSAVREYALQWDLEYRLGRRHQLRMGLRGARQRFDPGAVQLQGFAGDTLDLDSAERSLPVQPWQGALYLEDEITLGPRLRLNLGLRGEGFWVREEQYFSLQPRAALSWQLSERLTLQAGYTRQAQFLHLLSNTSVSLPLDLWVSATDKVPPQQAWQTSAGLIGRLIGGWQWQLEGYYKEMDGVIEFTEGANFLATGPETRTLGLTQAWESQVARGRGWSYGAELWLRKTQGRTTGWLSYTLSWTERQFDDLNQGEVFPFKYDRRHNLALVVNHRVRPGFRLNGTFVLQSGQRTTLPFAQYQPSTVISGRFGRSAQIYGPRNGFQLPIYHRLDLAASFDKEKKWGLRTWQFGVYNAYNRLNVFSATFDTNGAPPLSITSLFPLIPFVSYQLEF